jgi:hypothetical protein
VTRRTERRTHLFRPDARIKILFLYLLAVCAEACGILVHVAVLMATHEHLVVSDPRGELPVFLHRFHRLVALGTKVLRKWEGAVWDKQATSVVSLLTPQAIIEKMAYAIVNPVDAGLVPTAADWPGVTTRIDELGQAVWIIPRPEWFFDQKNPMWPQRVVLHLSWPPALLAEYGAERLRELVATEVERLEAEAHARAKAEGRPIGAMSPAQLAKASPFRQAKTPEPPRRPNPTFAVGRGRREERIAAALGVRAFRGEYRAAMDRWRAGDHEAMFPLGTWLMRRLHGARVPLPAAA